MNKQVGRFNVNVGDPSPIWIQLAVDDLTVGNFSVEDIKDLQYVCEAAIRDIEDKQKRAEARCLAAR